MTILALENKHITISKDELSHLPAESYQNGATLIESESQVAPAIETLKKAPLIGFDTETRPSFRKGVTYKVALMQLATEEECFLFRLNKIGFHPLLVDLLSDASIAKVGLSLHDDFHNLGKLTNFEPKGFIDLQKFVKQFHISDNSLSRIYGILFGRRICKAQRLTNWEAAALTTSQINYAAFDAIACIRIYRYLTAGYFDPATSPYLAPIPTDEPQQ